MPPLRSLLSTPSSTQATNLQQMNRDKSMPPICLTILKTNGEGVDNGDRVLNLHQVNLTDEEGDDDGDSKTVCEVNLVAPQNHEDAEGPSEDTKVRVSRCVKQRLGKLGIKERGRHAESSSAGRGANRGTEMRDIFSRRKKRCIVTRQYLRVVAQGEVRTEAQRCAIYEVGMNGKSLKEGRRRGDLILTSAGERNAEVRKRIVLGLYM